MKKYRKKPLIIEAIQWDGDDRGIVAFELKEMGCHFSYGACIEDGDKFELLIHTSEGTMTAEIGDYVIKGIKGEFYACKPNIFEESYEALE